MTFFQALQANPLLFSALIASLAASVVSGVMGTYVVAKRLSFLCGAISHSVLGGMGLFLWLERVHGWEGCNPVYGAILAAVVSGLTVGTIHLRYRQREDTAIAALWSVGMALGVIFVALTPGGNKDLLDFLIGNLLYVSKEDLITLWALNAIILFCVLLLHKRFVALCFDEDHAYLRGIPVTALYLFLLVLISLCIVLLTQIVGIILVITFLVIPPAIANLFCHRLSHMMWGAVGICVGCSLAGCYLAYTVDLPLGATIALEAGALYLAALAFRKKISFL